MTNQNKPPTNQLEDKIKKVREKSAHYREDDSKSTIANSFSEKNNAFAYIIDFTLPIILLAVAGVYLDKYLETLPAFSIILGLFGFAVGLITLIKRSYGYDTKRLGFIKNPKSRD